MLKKILFALCSFALLASSSLSYAKGTRLQMSFNLLPTGTAKTSTNSVFGTGKDDIDLDFAFGTTLGVYFPLMKHLELGMAAHTSVNVKADGDSGAGKLIDIVMPVRVPFMITESFEVRPFVEVGLQGLFWKDKSGFGPVVTPGLGLEYKVGDSKVVGLTADIAYSMGWAKVDVISNPLVTATVKGINYLHMRLGVSFKIN